MGGAAEWGGYGLHNGQRPNVTCPHDTICSQGRYLGGILGPIRKILKKCINLFNGMCLAQVSGGFEKNGFSGHLFGRTLGVIF